jgi:hypothetical protein
LGSGDFLDIDGQNVTVNLAKVYDFFAKKAGKKALGPGDEIAAKWPLKASSSVSIVCSRVDKSGLTHSRVIETLQFNFTMASSSATSIALDVRLGAVPLDEVAELQNELRVGLDVLPRRSREPLHEPAPLVVLALHAQGEYLGRLPRLRLVVRVVDADLRRVEVHVAQHEDGVLRVVGARGRASGSGGKQRPRAQFQEVPAV